jgi:lipid A 3-O-deacylase
MAMNIMKSASVYRSAITAAVISNASLLPTAAHADDKIFDELRFGASASIQSGHSKEDGVFPEVTVFFDPFDHDAATDWKQQLARPRLNIGTSIGTSGEATQIFGGFAWLRRRLAQWQSRLHR